MIKEDLDFMVVVCAAYAGCLLALLLWHYFGPDKEIYGVIQINKDLEK